MAKRKAPAVRSDVSASDWEERVGEANGFFDDAEQRQKRLGLADDDVIAANVSELLASQAAFTAANNEWVNWAWSRWLRDYVLRWFRADDVPVTAGEFVAALHDAWQGAECALTEAQLREGLID